MSDKGCRIRFGRVQLLELGFDTTNLADSTQLQEFVDVTTKPWRYRVPLDFGRINRLGIIDPFDS